MNMLQHNPSQKQGNSCKIKTAKTGKQKAELAIVTVMNKYNQNDLWQTRGKIQSQIM